MTLYEFTRWSGMVTGITVLAFLLFADVLPDELVLVGGGYVGVELGCAFAKLGSRVTIVEAWESLGHLEDHLVAEHMVAYRPRVKQMIRQSTLQILQSA